MTQTVIAFFDDLSTARDAVQILQDEGYTSSEIDLASPEGTRGEDAYKQFFNHLFSDRDEAERYTHAASQSGAVVTLHLKDEDRAFIAADILTKAGARQVDDPNVDYESSSSLVGYQDPSESSTAEGEERDERNAAGERIVEGTGKTREQIMKEAEARARVLRAQVEESLRVRD